MFINYKTKAKLALAQETPTVYIAALVYFVINFLFDRVLNRVAQPPNLVYSVFTEYGSTFDYVQQYLDSLTGRQVTYIGISSIAVAIIGLLLSYGFNFYCLKISRGHGGKVEDIFVGFYSPGRIIIADLLIAVRVFLWSLLFVLPGIAAALSYSQTYKIMADDPTVSPNQAINLSRDMMRGHRIEYLFFNLSFIGWAFLSAITWNIVDIYFVPYLTCSQCAFYDEISGAYGANDFGTSW